MTYVVDLTSALEQMKEQLRAELLAELAHRDDEPWPEWMSTATAARYLDLTEAALLKLVHREQIAYSQEAPGCRLNFNRHELDAHMRAHHHDARSQK